jgi:hypothetical protein
MAEGRAYIRQRHGGSLFLDGEAMLVRVNYPDEKVGGIS